MNNRYICHFIEEVYMKKRNAFYMSVLLSFVIIIASCGDESTDYGGEGADTSENQAPDFTLKDLDNSRSYHLYDYSGNPVFINWFWSG